MKLLLKVVLIIFIPFFLLFLDFWIWFVIYRFKGYKLPENISTYKKPSFFKRIFIDLPRQFWLDRFNKKPRRI